MIELLSALLSGVESIGSLTEWGVETSVDAIGAAFVTAYNAVLSVLPSMSDAPAIGDPTWLQWMNWFYPVGDLLDGLAVVVTLYVSWLAFRYVLRLIRAV